MSIRPIIIWLRRDLRLQDHPALLGAKNHPIIPIYIHAPEEEGSSKAGAASRVWLHHSLHRLQESFASHGVHLIIRKGKSLNILKELIATTNAEAVFWSRLYEPDLQKRDAVVKLAIKEMGVKAESFAANLFEPWTLFNKQNRPFKVFSYFWKACREINVRTPLTRAALIPFKGKVESVSIDELALLPKVDWHCKLLQEVEPGEKGAEKRLLHFLNQGVENYAERRNFPYDKGGVSHLSPHLHFGEISPFQVWHSALQHPLGEAFLRQIAWREFAAYLLYHFPFIVDRPFEEAFNQFDWEKDGKGLKLWQKGCTGYPIVDAGMRELWQTGTMHNRVRMIVGSFLVKDLLISWQEGAKWFWETLLDADLANNTLGWQWIGGMGADAAPYFRVFNPLLQGEKFDPKGEYVKKYLPELKGLSEKWIHRPFEAPEWELQKAGVSLGRTYPYPIVDHDVARKRALLRYNLSKHTKEEKERG